MKLKEMSYSSLKTNKIIILKKLKANISKKGNNCFKNSSIFTVKKRPVLSRRNEMII